MATNAVAIISGDWTNIGSGPITVLVSAISGNSRQILYQAAAADPGVGVFTGISLPIDRTTLINASGPIWARAMTVDGAAATATVEVADNTGGTTAIEAVGNAPYLASQTQVNASTTTAAALCAAAMPAVAGKTNYLFGFEVTGSGATAASIVAVTVTGVLGGTLTYVIAVPAGVTNAINPFLVEFSYPLQAAAPNTAITVTAASFGAGNVNEVVNVHGWVQ